jgi:hypothetical protein
MYTQVFCFTSIACILVTTFFITNKYLLFLHQTYMAEDTSFPSFVPPQQRQETYYNHMDGQ